MNPIQQAIEALESCRIIATPSGRDLSPRLVKEALTSLRSLQKEVEGGLPEPYGFLHDASGNDPLTFKRGPITDAFALTCSTMPVYTVDQLRTAVAAALRRGAVNSGWCVTSEELAQWTDAYAAFKGAFDTPQMRRQFNDEYAEDARHRLREFNERMLSAAPSPEATQPATDVDLINRGCRHQTDLLTVATQPTQAEAPSERETFEAWWYDNYHAGRIHADSHGIYHATEVQAAWEAWQARAALATQQVAFTQADMNAEYVRGRADGWNAACVAEPPRRQQAVQGEPVHPNHRSDLRYVLATLNDCNANLKMKAELRERVQASIVGMRYVISRTEAGPVQQEKEERRPFTNEQIARMWSWSQSAEAERTANTQQHAFARAIEAAHGITATSGKEGGND